MALMSSIFVGLQTGQQYSNLLRARLLYSCIIVVLVRSLNTLSTHAAVLRAELIILPIWGDQELSAETKTPRSLTVSLGLMKLSFAVE